MKLNYFSKQLSTVGRWVATAFFCVSAIAVAWQGAFSLNATAMAAPAPGLIADAGAKIQAKASEDAGRTKGFVRDTADKVKQTAKNNAARVDQATDSGSFAERKAKKDAARIEKRANQDAARTEGAIDKTKNAVERTVDGIKDVFGN